MATEIPVDNAPTETATIQKVQVKVPVPFKEGHPLRATEADALNAYYVNCIRNALVPRLKKNHGDDLSKLDAATMQKEVNAFCKEYDFGMTAGRTADPVEHEMMEIARNLVRKAIVNKGNQLKDYKTKDITAKARQLLDHEQHGPKIRKQAEQIVKQRESLADIDI